MGQISCQGRNCMPRYAPGCAVYTTAQVDVHHCFIISCKDQYFQAFDNLLKLHSLYESLKTCFLPASLLVAKIKKKIYIQGEQPVKEYVLIQKEFAPLTYTQ